MLCAVKVVIGKWKETGGEGNDGACRKGFPRLAPFPHLHLPSAVALDRLLLSHCLPQIDLIDKTSIFFPPSVRSQTFAQQGIFASTSYQSLRWRKISMCSKILGFFREKSLIESKKHQAVCFFQEDRPNPRRPLLNKCKYSPFAWLICLDLIAL